MKNSFSLGLLHVQPELTALQTLGCYWVTCARQDDACTFIRQVISHQQAVRMDWFEDNQILAEVSNIKKLTTMAIQDLTPVSETSRNA